MRPSPLLPFLLILLLSASASATAAQPVLDGHWILDESLSEDAEDVFEDRMRRRRFPTPGPQLRTGERPSDMDVQQQAYWATIRDSREKRSLKDLRRLGTVYPLLKASEIDIAPNEQGMVITYDGALPRQVKPNPNGKVYSASGDELVADTLGYTLSYWQDGALVMETDPPNGGKYVERLRLDNGSAHLVYSIRVQSTNLSEPTELTRVFARGGDK